MNKIRKESHDILKSFLSTPENELALIDLVSALIFVPEKYVAASEFATIIQAAKFDGQRELLESVQVALQDIKENTPYEIS